MIEFNNIGESKIQDCLKEIFPGKNITKITIIPEISVNQLVTFVIDQQKYLMKILVRSPASEHEYFRLEKEAKLLEKFKHLQAGKGVAEKDIITVPVPQVFHVEESIELLGHKFLIMEYIYGSTIEDLWPILSLEEKETIIKQLIKIVQGIHSVKYEMFGQLEDYHLARNFYSFESLIKADVRKYARILGRQEILPVSLVTESVRFIENNLERFSFKTNPTLVHRDLQPTNFIVNKNNEDIYQIEAVLDFEWSYSGNPLYDLFDVEEWLSSEKRLIEKFFFGYFNGKKTNLDEFQLEREIYQIHSSLETIAIGWVKFHPTKINIKRVENNLKEIIEK